MRNRFTALLSLAFLFLPAALAGKEPKNELADLDLTQRYLVLEGVDPSTPRGEEALNQAGSAGYRFVAGDIVDRSDGGYPSYLSLVVMEKTTGHTTPYRYISSNGKQWEFNLAASRGFHLAYSRFLADWLSELNKAGSQGFRLLPRLWGFLEKPPTSDCQYQYVVVRAEQKFMGSPKDISAFLKELDDTAHKGHEIVLFNFPSAFLQKTAETGAEPLPNLEDAARPVPTPRFLLLAGKKTSTLEEELAAATGYRLVAADRRSGGLPLGPFLLLEKVLGFSQSYEYVISAGSPNTVEKRINEAAARGFRLQLSGLDYTGGGLWAVMEKRTEPPALYQYRILETFRLSTLQKELNEAVQQGYEVVAARHDTSLLLVLERPRRPGEP